MVLEAIMVCMDNSEWSRNGDFAPSRWDSQQDAANIICEAKTQQNPENTLGVMAYAGRRVEVKLTQTNDISALLNSIASASIDGEADFLTAVKVAQLSLKHRQNKSQRQRIIIFVGHPLKEDEATFEELGVRMKRNNVAVDVINFAHPENEAKLRAMVTAANSNGNSHFLDVPMGVSMITDVLIASPIINEGMDTGMADVSGGNAGGAGVPAAPARFEEFGGIDPNLDPELAMALRISMEEERARQHQPEAAQPQPDASGAQALVQALAAQDAQMAAGDDDDEDLDEEAILQRALMLSQVDPVPQRGAGAAQETPGASTQKADAANDMKELLKDNEFMQDIAKDLGIDFGDLGGEEKTDEQKKKEEEDKKK